MANTPQKPSSDPNHLNETIESRKDAADGVRQILQALARLIVTDRRAVALASHRGEILLANGASQRLGLSQENLLASLDWTDLCTRVRRSGSETLVWERQGHTFEGEIVHVPMGPVEGFLIRLAQENQEVLLLRNRARAATLMRVAHDLRTPIQSLLSAAHSLQSEAQTEADAPARIRRAAELALDHISNVLAVIGGEQARRGGQPDEDFRIVDEVSNLVTMVSPIAEARATEISLSVTAPKDLTLHGPLRFIRAMCQNLIDNSVNHGGGQVELSLHAAPLAEDTAEENAEEIWAIRLRLADQGGGLPAPQRARLNAALGLGPQAAALAGTAERPSAGLNVLAHALRQLGATIEVFDRAPDGSPLPLEHSSRVIGTVFEVTFSLPRAPDFLVKTEEPSEKPSKPLAGKHILLIEDSPASRDWLTHILEAGGARVSAVGSGPEAFALLSRNEIATSVNLVLTDVTLPRMSGIEVAAHLQKGDPASAVVWRGKIVGLTAHADDRIRTACLNAGMLLVLEKPIQPSVLLKALSDVFERGALNTEATKTLMPEEILAQGVVGDLLDQLGLDRTRAFMTRALKEGKDIVDEFRSDGIGPETGRRLHAATGACGLTGLALVEQKLRRLELAVEVQDESKIAFALDGLDEAFAETAAEIERLSLAR